jgi:4'-phosphopantetheinyl transferase
VISWSPQSEVTGLDPGVVHVWRLALDDSRHEIASARAVLSADEAQRADRFLFDKDRRRFVACRSALRVLLGRYLHVGPGSIEFRYNPFGKPELAGAPPLPLRFNVSHSESWALIAVTVQHRVGVDVERLRPIENIDSLARLCLSDRELADYRRLPTDQRMPAFFQAWTRKEAFIKACGVGLSRPLHDCEVTFAPGEPARLLRVAGDGTPPADWSLSAIETAAGYVGAVAVDVAQVRIEYYELRG